MSSVEKDRENFDAAFAKLVNELTLENEENAEVADALKNLREVLEYNVPGGKRNRGLSVIGSLRHLMKPEEMTEEIVSHAILLGWCVEWFQAFFLVADDIMDQSLTRRGQLCWYKKPDVGLVAINDCIMIEQTVFALLKKHIRNKPYYIDVLEIFHEVAYLTSLGQSMDLITKPGKDFENFTLKRYKAIVKHKTAYYSFYLPVALAMHMSGLAEKELLENAKAILLEMGEYFQIQDDYLDVYGDPSVTGKIGTDIEENKCTWLIVKALERANPEQLNIIKENYGKNDKDSSAKVKQVYNKLTLDQVFHEYENVSHLNMCQLLEDKSVGLPKEMFAEFMAKIYKRKK